MDYLSARLDWLRSSQNSDGGWGYFPGKQSWLEPTIYASLALARDKDSIEHVRRSWKLVRSWQNADGGWRPCAAVSQSTCVTALAVILADSLAGYEPEVSRGAKWLLAGAGAESSILNRVLRFSGISAIEREVSDAGWPWRPGTSAWVEPTAQALLALKKVMHRKPGRTISRRVEEGHRMLLEVRCRDGGWNYGSPRAIGVDLPSYAQTTALALIGLGERAPAGARERALRYLDDKGTTALGRAWLRIALGIPNENGSGLGPRQDTLLYAIEALDGHLLRPGVRA
jgi:hypothetical protein